MFKVNEGNKTARTKRATLKREDVKNTIIVFGRKKHYWGLYSDCISFGSDQPGLFVHTITRCYQNDQNKTTRTKSASLREDVSNTIIVFGRKQHYVFRLYFVRFNPASAFVHTITRCYPNGGNKTTHQINAT